MSELKSAIKILHARKDRAYGAAWKRRGERISVIPNIARKVDRLTTFVDNQSLLTDEHVLDTAIDLYVYSVKYLLFLAEEHQALEKRLPHFHPIRPLTDVAENFDQLVDGETFAAARDLDMTKSITKISGLFEMLWPAVESGTSAERRFELADALAKAAAQLVAKITADQPAAAEHFIHQELSRV